MLAANLLFSSPLAAAAAPAVAAPSSLEAARALAGSGNFSGAITELASYSAANPADTEAARYLGDLYVRTGDLKSAEDTYVAILQAAPRDKTTHDRLGNVYAADDRVSDAIEQYQLSLPDVIAYYDLVRLHRRVGDLAQFVARSQARAERNAQDYGAQIGYGAILRALRRPAEALDYLRRAVALQPQSCAALTELGNAFLDLDKRGLAGDEFRDCLAVLPNDYGALVDLSLTYDPNREADAARGLLERALQLQPDRPEALIDYGYLTDATGDMQAAMRYYERALETDVLSRDAYLDLGYDYGELHMFAQAEAAFLKGLSVSPNDGRIEYLLGQAYSEQGKASLAQMEFSAATHSDEPEVAQAATATLATMQ
jgi:tetratricopeptide (TPR) repeat protein